MLVSCHASTAQHYTLHRLSLALCSYRRTVNREFEEAIVQTSASTMCRLGDIAKTIDLQGVFVIIGDSTKFKGFFRNCYRTSAHEKLKTPRKTIRKVDLLSLAFYNARNLHYLECNIFAIKSNIGPKISHNVRVDCKVAEDISGQRFL